jgi:microsomal dipeptidase-like Zn-dependent dipeptidase
MANRTPPPIVGAVPGKPMIHGWADIHAHQLSNLGFGGGLVDGAHDYQPRGSYDWDSPMPGCNGSHGLTWIPGTIKITIGPLAAFQTKMEIEVGRHSTNFSGTNVRRTALWQNVHHQQYWKGWLKNAHDNGMKLFVMSAVSNELLCNVIPPQYRLRNGVHPVGCDDWSNVVRQINAAKKFARENSWYRIATTPEQARQIIAEGDLAVILAVEASNIWGHTNDWDSIRHRIDSLYNMGVRSMQPVHMFDNNVSGTARFMGIMDIASGIQNALHAGIHPLFYVANPGAFVGAVQIFKTHSDKDGNNLKGLSTNGVKMIDHMMNKKIIIDLAHVSDRAFTKAYTRMKARQYYPMVVTHSHFKAMFNKEKQDEKKHDAEKIIKIRETGGIFGLRPGPDRVKTYTRSGVANNCQGSSRSFAQSYMLGVKGYRLPMAFGMDMNGMIAMARPRFVGGKWSSISNKHNWACGADLQDPLFFGTPQKEKRVHDQTPARERSFQSKRTNTSYDYIGLAHVGHIKNFMKDLENLGVQTNLLWQGAEAYVQTWERIHAPRTGPKEANPTVDETGLDHDSLVDPCTGKRKKLGGHNGLPVCKRIPHFKLKSSKCKGNKGSKWTSPYTGKGYCVKKSGDMYKARELK